MGTVICIIISVIGFLLVSMGISCIKFSVRGDGEILDLFGGLIVLFIGVLIILKPLIYLINA